MKKYSSYKDSGVDWIGKIPKHWNKRKVAWSFNIIGSGTTPKSDDMKFYENGTINWLITGDLNDNYVNETSKKITEFAIKSHSALKLFSPNSIAIAMYGATIGKLGILNIATTTNQASCILSESSYFDIKYVFFWLLSSRNDIINLSYGGGQPNISQDIIKNLKITHPPLSEQIQIANFLDSKTEKIDKLIELKEKKIELLKEKRTATINHAVTKGLNPNVEFKDCGVEWIGEIPKHWKMFRVNSLGTFFKGSGIKKDEVKETGIPCIRYGEIYTRYDRIVYEPISFIDVETSKESVYIKKGDVLYTGSGETVEDIGKSVVYFGENEICVGGDIIVQRLNNNATPLFISYLMNTKHIQQQKSIMGKGEIIVHIYPKNIKEIITPLPPIQEQQQIVEYLDYQTNEIDSLISLEQNKIELLKEYKQSLISEVVTGKIRVCEYDNSTKSEPIIA